MFPEPDLSARDPLVITNVTAVTMDPRLGDLQQATVTVDDGVITAVSTDVPVPHPPGARVIDGSGLLALPGFVDTHWHLWNSLLRGSVGEAPGHDYFTVKRALGPITLWRTSTGPPGSLSPRR